MSQKHGSSGWPGRVGFWHGSALLPPTSRPAADPRAAVGRAAGKRTQVQPDPLAPRSALAADCCIGPGRFRYADGKDGRSTWTTLITLPSPSDMSLTALTLS